MFKVIVISILVVTNIFAKENNMQFFLIEVDQSSDMKIKVNDITMFDSRKGQTNGRYILNHYFNNGSNEINISISSDSKVNNVLDIFNNFRIYKSKSEKLSNVDEVIYKPSKDDSLIFKEKRNDKYIYTFQIKIIIDDFFTWKFKKSEKIELNDKNKAHLLVKIKELQKILLEKDTQQFHKLLLLKNKENTEGTYRDIKDVENNINHMLNNVFNGKSFKVGTIDVDEMDYIFEANHRIIEVKLDKKFPLIVGSDGGRMGIPLRFIKEDGQFYFYK